MNTQGRSIKPRVTVTTPVPLVAQIAATLETLGVMRHAVERDHRFAGFDAAEFTAAIVAVTRFRARAERLEAWTL